MTEGLDVAVWVEFPDPATAADDGAETVIRADLAWLTSRWTCMFGRGCPGIQAELPDAGCCSLGAHFTGPDDEARVAAAVAQLDDASWQNRPDWAANWIDADDDERKTRTVATGCVFLNRPDFPGGGGCALHHLAARAGRSVLTTKPDVCWQLPLRRSYRTVTRLDGTSYLELSIGAFDRVAWGPGGHDLDWYCTSAPEALIAPAPLFRTLAAELRELIGGPAYEVLARQCEAFDAPPTTWAPLIERAAGAERLLVALDFDGTLAPMGADLDRSRILPAGVAALGRLAAVGSVHLALVSGRMIDDLERMAEVPDGTWLSGSHGAEWARVVAGAVEREPLAFSPEQVARLAEIKRALDAIAADDAAAFIEDKPYSATLHTRAVADRAKAEAMVEAVVETGQRLGAGLMLAQGMTELMVIEANKGDALEVLRRRTGATTVIYAGDERADESALATLGADDIGVHVGVGHSIAELRIATPHDMCRFLTLLADRLEAKP